MDTVPATRRADVAVGLVAMAFTHVAFFVACSEGFLEREGIDCDYEVLGSPDAVTAALAGGTIQMAPTTPEGAIADHAAGGDLVIIAGGANKLPLRLIGRPEHRDLASLRGARIGVSSVHEGTVHVIQTMLASAGLQPADYEFEVVGAHPRRWELLQEGAIDAGLQLTPYDRIAIDAGFTDLGDPTQFVPEFAFNAIVTDRRWAESHADVATAFVGALLDATAWTYSQPSGAARALASLTGYDSALVAQSVQELVEREVIPRQMAVSDAGLRQVLAAMRANGRLPAGTSTDPRAYVDGRYLKTAGKLRDLDLDALS
jgi:ABC-type nitrate/sulfonate/bicarbonate transport system substrate-binding protein